MNKPVQAEQRHCQWVMSKVWDLRSGDQLCDIAIKVEEKVFHCHRIILSAASEYFRVMFGGGFSEGSMTEVTLHGVEVNLFETILKFIYTGDVGINTSNACDLMYAAEFYGLGPLLEECLIEFARKACPTLPSEDILTMFMSAHRAKMKALFRFLSEHIFNYFSIISKCLEFVHLTWDSLKEFFKIVCNPCLSVPPDTFVEGILEWIRCQVHVSVDERRAYLGQFVDIMLATESFTDCTWRMLDQLDKRTFAILDERPPKLLRAFLRRISTRCDDPGSPYMFTLHEMKTGSAWAYSGEFKWFSKDMKSIVIDDSLYSLFYEGYNKMPNRDPRAFTRASRTSMYQPLSLSPPPYMMRSFDICGNDNNIFICDKNCNFVPNNFRDPAFSLEELSRGVFLYKRDVDKWLPLPHTNRNPYSCMTCDERLVYLIGGTVQGHECARVQAYDLRTAAWMVLPPTEKVHQDAACCIRDGKVWVAGGEDNPSAVEIFDPISATWERGKEMREIFSAEHELVSWESVFHGPILVSFCRSWLVEHRIYFSDDSHPMGWTPLSDLFRAFKNSRLTGPYEDWMVCLMDMVAF